MNRREWTIKDVKVLALLEMTRETSAFVRDGLVAATAEAPAYVVVNLADVHHLDSMGLTFLLDALKRARFNQGDLHLCGVQHPIRLILELTRLHQVFKIYPSEQDAIQAFFNADVEAVTLGETERCDDGSQREWNPYLGDNLSNRDEC